MADRRATPGNIPYDINSAGVCFDKNTQEFVQPPVGKGLTCATYIKAVFFHFGFSLLDEATGSFCDVLGFGSSLIDALTLGACHAISKTVDHAGYGRPN
jgi:hypothetical protein